MSFETKRDVLLTLHSYTGAGFLILSVLFAVVLGSVMSHSAHRTWPTWWIRHAPKVIRLMLVGSAFAWFGAGWDQIQRAFDLSRGYELLKTQHLLSSSPTFTRSFASHLLSELGQALGVTAFIVAALLFWHARRSGSEE